MELSIEILLHFDRNRLSQNLTSLSLYFSHYQKPHQLSLSLCSFTPLLSNPLSLSRSGSRFSPLSCSHRTPTAPSLESPSSGQTAAADLKLQASNNGSLCNPGVKLQPVILANAKIAKATSGPQKEKITNGPKASCCFANPDKFVEEILEKTSLVVLLEIKDDSIKQYGDQLGSIVANNINRQLTTELKNITSEIFKALKKTRLIVGVDKKEMQYSRYGRTNEGISFVGKTRPWLTFSVFFLIF